MIIDSSSSSSTTTTTNNNNNDNKTTLCSLLLLFVLLLLLWLVVVVVRVTVSATGFRRGNDMVGNPHRAQTSQLEPFELVLSLKSDKQLSIERFEPTASQSTVSSAPLIYIHACYITWCDVML